MSVFAHSSPLVILCRYFMEPKSSLMSHLENVVAAAEKEKKSAEGSLEALGKQQEGILKEIDEMASSAQR